MARGNAVYYTGVVPPAQGHLTVQAIQSSSAKLNIVLVDSVKEMDRAFEDIRFFGQADTVDTFHVLELPETMTGDEDAEVRGLEARFDRMTALTALANCGNEKRVVITTPDAVRSEVPALQALLESEISLKVGDTYSFTGLIERLNDLGYDHESEVEGPGQFAVRGGIVDLYPVNCERPFRLDFFGDELEEIRSFEPDSQRSSEKVELLTVSPPPGRPLKLAETGLLEYLPEQVQWHVWEPVQVEETSPEFFSTRTEGISLSTILESRSNKGDRWLGYTALNEVSLFFNDGVKKVDVGSEGLTQYRSFPADQALGMDRFYQEQEERVKFFKQVWEWQRGGYDVVFSVQTQGEADRLKEFLSDSEELKGFDVPVQLGALAEGFRYDYPEDAQKAGVVFVTDSEIFARYRRRLPRGNTRKMANRKQVDQLLDFSELVDGDFLVHLSTGICIYRGLGKLDTKSGFKEVISLEFDEGIILHVPLHESHLLSRYVGLKKFRPSLGKVGSNRWDKVRRQAEEATLDLAARLLNNQANRDSKIGHAFGPDDNWQREFEAAFPFKETRDQLTAIEDSKRDMEKPQPMDRLICGDVGYGKTEVAIRAAFKAVLGGKQVALLGPTTVLTQQHFKTFRDRMASFPVTVEMLNRFRTKHEQTKILERLASGKIDIVVGTHRLLSKDVGFKDLGLLVIDEEHRFGVKHKERLKELRVNVDVLSLSATPIPRTLYMALMGARDLSVIETAPVNRRPIKTIIRDFNYEVVVSAIRAEVDRGGQVFYLHNRVQSIYAVEEKLVELMPDVSFVVGHGQMSEGALEKVMNRFVEGEYDVLISTTIIESGLDIPNANTMIIEAADRFGLSQLYQIRGRVGRFTRQAYAYLLLHRHARVLEMARKRLAALKQYNQLGAGFRIAMRDLELRGAGNLLGSEQSGHIAGVGFELYCQLLKQSISRLKGEKSALRIRASVSLDFVFIGEQGDADDSVAIDSYQAIRNEELSGTMGKSIEAGIPRSYVSETRLRIELYRDLAMAEDLEAIQELEKSLVDRFGKYPQQVKALIQVSKIRALSELKGIDLVETEGNRLKCRLVGGKHDNFIMPGNRFPRLESKAPFKKLQNILQFINRQKSI